MKKSFISIAVIVVLVAITLFLNLSKTNTSDSAANVDGLETKVATGYLAPNFTIEHVDGKKISLSDFKGKPVFINFWASWCPPCQEEMPFIQKAYEDYGDKIEFVMINVIETDTLQNMESYIAENGYTFPVYLDKKNVVTDLYNIYGFPTSFFIDSKGVIRELVTGGMTKAFFTQKIQDLLRN